jgi:fluoroquinolone resistance protein
MDAAQLHDRLTNGAPIEGASLTDIDWAERRYDDAMFVDCGFSAAQFTATGLAGARFTRCRFAHADLHEATFEDCVFVDRAEKVEGCNFAFSDLRDVRWLQCDLSLAVFDRCDLFSVELDRCNLLGARFTKVDFSHAYSRKVITTRARFRGCNLGLAEMAELRLASCDLSGSRFREANLAGTDLSGADLRDCDLFQAVLDGARLDRADLTGAEISGLNLLRLAGFARMKINADQQYALLAALEIEVEP